MPRTARRLIAIAILSLTGFAAAHTPALSHVAGGSVGIGGPLQMQMTRLAGGSVGTGGPLSQTTPPA